MKKLYLDVGSSTLKLYTETEKGNLQLIETKSFHFKQDFDPIMGLTEKNKQELISYIKTIQKRYKGYVIKSYATAMFRKLPLSARRLLIDDIFRETGVFFNVISHDLEGHYLEQALSAEYNLNEPLLLINIGGGSTELVVRENGSTVARYNLEIGVGTVLQDFPYLNEKYSRHQLRDVVSNIIKKLPEIDFEIPHAIYNGGELTYMKLVGYNLQKNAVMNDGDHPNHIETNDFCRKNKEVFESISIQDLEDLMPNDPMWMHGARACSAIAQAIVGHFKIKQLIPSDSNMIHGVVKQEHRVVVLSGSFRKHLDYIIKIKRELGRANTEVLSPRFEEPKNPGDEFVVFEGEQGLSPLELERYHLDMIEKCDALIVCASGGYVGASALIEIGYAHALGKRIIFTEEPEEFMLRTLPAEIGL
jgi:hypothetical protein